MLSDFKTQKILSNKITQRKVKLKYCVPNIIKINSLFVWIKIKH